MLDQDEQSALEQSSRAVQTTVSAHLAAITSPAALIHFISNLQTGIDKVTQQAQTNGAELACKPGCSHCCHAPVKALAPEVFKIAREIKKLDPESMLAITERLSDYLQQQSSSGMQWQTRPPCPFLQNNLCSIYAIRPAVCRRAHSLKLDPCATSAPEIPQQLEIVLGAEALLQGTAAAYESRGLDAGYYDFCGALLLVLNDTSAEVRWLGGEAVFER